MSIKYEPSKLIRKLRKRARAVVRSDLTVNRSAVKALTEFGLLPKKTLESVALKVIKQERANKRSSGERRAVLQSRVQSAVLHEQTRVIQKAYRGEFYKWLPSVAKEPRPEHEKNYGKIFQVGVGDSEGNDPGDLINCQCGMELLVDDNTEEFNERLEEAL
jgi:hypothetical protein